MTARPHFRRRSVRLCTAALIVGVTLAPSRAEAASLTVTLTMNGVQDPTGLIGLEKGDILVIQVRGTYPSCFTFNADAVAAQNKVDKATGEAPQPEDVTFHIIYDGTATGYRIKATRIQNGPSFCSAVPVAGIPDLDHTVLIQEYGWQIATTGAFTVDTLTDPVFYLTPTTQGSQAGYLVAENKDARSTFSLGLAAMIHLYSSSPTTLRLFKSQTVSWAPISFGLGINTSGATSYFMGTSIKVGDSFYFTVGAALGQEKRLPDGVTTMPPTNFTTNANALSSLPTRTATSIFFAFSYSFIDVGLTRFTKQFEDPAPQNAGNGAAPNTGNNSNAQQIQLTPTTGPAGQAVNITVPGAAFVGDKAKDAVTVTVNGNPVDVTATNGTDLIPITIPQDAKGVVTVKVTYNGNSSEAKFTVK